MDLDNYQPEDIDLSRKLVYDKNVLTLQCRIYYDGDDGSEVLFQAPDEEFADAFVTRWNEAIGEDESLQGAVEYKQTCLTLADQQSEKLAADVERLQTKLGNIEADIRCFLDELPYIEDTALTRQLRRHVWNDDDSRQQREQEA